MRIIWVLGLLLSLNAEAAFKLENDEILPFSNIHYPLKELIKDYSELMNLNATYPLDLISDKAEIYVELNSKTPKSTFTAIFNGLLDSMGYTVIVDDGFLWIKEQRDIRYTPSPVYLDQSFPKDASYGIAVHRLKYPLSTEVCRNLRPFMSRYGRIIDFSDARTLVIHEKGDNLERLLKTAEFLDTEIAYKNLLANVPKPDEDEGNPLQEKILELELDKKLLEKKYLDLKGEKQ
jgi:type II secretory pathway component GspD/PulD (secretin)